MSSTNSERVIIASAPGKVLITGGYLVLDQKYTGLVIGTSARFYTIIKNKHSQQEINITVRSPQFNQPDWEYKASLLEDKLDFTAKESDTPNKFVETCLRFSLIVILQLIGSSQFMKVLDNGLDISIIGDNDFYSQREELEKLGFSVKNASAREQLKPFCDTHATLKTVNKTGLGSSAALTTSLVGALFLYFNVFSDASLEDEKNLTWIHNVAQFVHCFAQGKVGSGFDVSAAVFGSHRYQRFNPSILTPIMNENIDPISLTKALDVENKSWDNKVFNVGLPPQFQMILADIDAGSHTPTLVSQVLKWRKEQPEEANQLWDELDNYNSRVEQHFRDLTLAAQCDETSYKDALAEVVDLPVSQWEKIQHDTKVHQFLIELAADFRKVRQLLQKMSLATGVPIEPSEQTQLLDQCMEVPGTIMAGVPGAGGYDAIFCIVLSEEAKDGVHKIWEQWSLCSVSPLISQADSTGITNIDPTSSIGKICLKRS
ncbi:unnamed protein product [Cunninghamella blakesleeana]